MKQTILALALIAALLSGCTGNALQIPAENVAEIWFDTLPQEAGGPRHTFDDQLLERLVQAFNAQRLRPIPAERAEELSGQTTLIEIRLTDGTSARYASNGVTLADGEGSRYKIGKPMDWEPLLAEMAYAPAITGVIDSVTEREGFYALMVLVDAGSQAALSDKTSLRVPTAMISGKVPEAGDRITAYLDGPVAESYPTQSRAWSAVIQAPDRP